jgi:hypothetical protein
VPPEEQAIGQALLGMADVPFWLSWGAMGLGAFFLLRQGVRAFTALHTVADTPTARIRTAPQGYVELEGLARDPGAPLTAPLTRAPCLWYRFQIEERRRQGRGDTWVTVERGASERAFLLDDGSGQCLVEPAGARIEPRGRDVWHGPRRDPGDRRAGGGTLWGLIQLPVGFGDRYRFTEERITAGEPIYLLGHFETPRRGPEEERDLTRSLLRVWKRDPARMAALDTDGDGAISAAEWDQARQQAGRLARASEQARGRAPVMPRVRDPGAAARPYVIATYTQAELLRTLRRRAFGYAAGFLALVSVLGFAFLARLSGG